MTPAVYNWFGTVSSAVSNVANYAPAGGAIPAAPPGVLDKIVCDPANVLLGSVSFGALTFDAAFAAAGVNEVEMLTGYVGTLTVDQSVTIDTIKTNVAAAGNNSQRIVVNPGNTLTTSDADLNGGELVAVNGAAGLCEIVISANPAGGLGKFQVKQPVKLIGNLHVETGASASINASLTLDQAEVRNEGTATWTTGSFFTLGESRWWNVVGSQGLYVSGPDGRSLGPNLTVLNQSTVEVNLDNPADSLDFEAELENQSVPFANNVATFSAVKGRVIFEGAVSADGIFDVDSDAVLKVRNTFTSHGAGFFGDGSVEVRGSDADVITPAGSVTDFWTVVLLEEYGGFSGAGEVRFKDLLDIDKGEFVGTTAIASQVHIGHGAIAPLRLFSTDLSLGTTEWQFGNIQVNASNIYNLGVLTVRSNTGITKTPDLGAMNPDSSYFANTFTGTVLINNGTTTTRLAIEFENFGGLLGAGKVQFNKGITQSAGYFTVPGELDLGGNDFLVLGGVVTLVADINQGNLKVLGGVVVVESAVSVSGNLEFGAGGTLKIRMDAAGNGKITAGGNADLGGTLLVDPIGNYQPLPGTKRKFLTVNGTMTGTFSPPGGWTVNYGVDDAELEKLGGIQIGPPPP